MTRFCFFLVLTGALCIGSCDNEQETGVPDVLLEIQELPQAPFTTLSITQEEAGQDSLWIRIYMESEKLLPDTLYHSSTYPFLISHIGKDDISLTPLFSGIFILGRLTTTVLPPESKVLTHEYKTKRRTKDSYSIIAVLSFYESEQEAEQSTGYEKELWMVSNSVSIPAR
ncbi:MAG: hypothetical protein AAFW89_00485 [Bacteroidota bacterium]